MDTIDTALEQAREHGTKAAVAQNQRDAARVTHWRDYHRRWLTAKRTHRHELFEARAVNALPSVE